MYKFPASVIKNMKDKYPLHSEATIEVALRGFLEYIELVKLYVEVPMFSKSVDDVWHFMILDTKEYHRFCEERLGYFLHHIPKEEGTKSQEEENKALRLLWMRACKLRGFNPFSYSPYECPDLFYADKVLYSTSISTINLVGEVLHAKASVENREKGLFSVFRKKDTSEYTKALKDKYDSHDKEVYDPTTDLMLQTLVVSSIFDGSGNVKEDVKKETIIASDPLDIYSSSYYDTPTSHNHNTHSCSSCSSSSCSSSSCSSSSCSSSSCSS